MNRIFLRRRWRFQFPGQFNRGRGNSFVHFWQWMALP